MDTIINAVMIPLFALVPGFVLVAVYRRNRRGPDPSEAKFVASSLVASILPHLILLHWSLGSIEDFHKTGLEVITYRSTIILLLALTLVIPVALGLVLSWLTELNWVEEWILGRVGWSRAARTRTAWEWGLGDLDQR